MNKIELHIIALSNSESSEGNFALIMEELKGLRRFAIIIGTFEAQAIAIFLERMETNRPLTHDLFKNTLDKNGIKIKEVIITEIVDDIFHSKLIGEDANGETFEIDARSSDALAMAVRYGCPIFTTEEILSEVGSVLGNQSKAFTNKRGSLSEYTLAELEHILAQVLEKEDYESASKVRDAIRAKSK